MHIIDESPKRLIEVDGLGIVVSAHRVNAGQQPALTGFGDFFWFGCDDTEQAAELVVDIVARRIPARFGLDARHDVQVLCPMLRRNLLYTALTRARKLVVLTTNPPGTSPLIL